MNLLNLSVTAIELIGSSMPGRQPGMVKAEDLHEGIDKDIISTADLDRAEGGCRPIRSQCVS